MNEFESRVINQCLNIADSFKLAPVKVIVDEYLSLIDNEDKITTFVDLSGTPEGLVEVATSICNENVLGKYEKLFRACEDWEVRIEYGEEAAVFAGENIPECKIVDDKLELHKPLRLIVTTPSTSLSNRIVILKSAGNIEEASTREVASSGRLVLLTNATMAMTNVQQGWIDSFVKERFNFDRFAVYVSLTDKLLEDSQETEVVEYVKSYFDKYGVVIPVIFGNSITAEFIVNDSPEQYDQAKSCMLRNMIHEIDNVLENEAKSLGVTAEEYARISKEISTLSAAFIRAGEISANNVLGNHISEIVDAIDRSADEYSSEMFESIKKTILVAKDIDDVEEKITPYMEKSWEFFAKETSGQIARDFDAINLKLTKRMEDDVEKMVNALDINAQAVIAEFVNNSESMYIPSPGFEHASDEARKAVGRNARNLIILSIPMLFISPTLSVATLLGGGIYSKLGKKQEDRKYRDELINHVDRACMNAKKNAVSSFKNSLHEEQQRMKKLVLEGYQNFLNLIVQNLEERKKDADANAIKATELMAAKEELDKLL